MTWLTGTRIARGVAAVVVIAVVLLGLRLVLKGPKENTVTAYFPVTVHVYAGSHVDVLGVPIGTVSSVTPDGTKVKVTITYDASHKVPANASAVVVDPTLVADRVVQLTPVYSGGPVMQDHAVIPIERTDVPVELDELDANLVKLTDALGPNGANATGALSRAIAVGAKNLHGQGAKANTTITRLSQLVSTLDDNRDALTSTVNNLASFTETLASSDAQTRAFTQDLSQVSGQLASERTAFAGAIRNLGIALDEVTTFIKHNRSLLATDVQGLTTVTHVLSKERLLLGRLADIGGVGISNYSHLYTPSQRTYNARFNGVTFTDTPVQYLCQLLGAAGASAEQCIKVLAPIKGLHIPSSAKRAHE